MTDMQPIRRKTSLLERADARFDLGGPLRRDPAPLRDVTAPRVAPAVPASAAPISAPEPVEAVVQATPVSAPAPIAAPAPAATAVDRSPVPVARATQPAPARRSSTAVQPLDRRILADHALIDPEGGPNALSEEFRIIKRQILKGAPALVHGTRVLVTSAQPDEGKTFTAINLALSLAAERDRSVLLIDGDCARGDVPRRLGLSAGPGLMDLLQNPSLTPAECIIDTDVPGLSLLPAGRASTRDTEYLASDRMTELLAELERDAPDRILLFDSTPLLAASSAGVLAALAGQILVVVRAEVTREAALRDAIGLIGQHPGISLLLNRVRFTPEGRRFGSYYGEGG